MNRPATLYFMCGKMAAGKSTLAKTLAQRQNAILLVQDEFLETLFPGEIADIPAFVKFSSRVKAALTPHVCALLSRGVSVVLDFPGNTKTQRAWFRELFEKARAKHELHFVDVPDDICKRQLMERNKERPTQETFTTDAEFDAITRYFQPPSDDEGFNVIRHQRS
jgi:predicted kinase